MELCLLLLGRVLLLLRADGLANPYCRGDRPDGEEPDGEHAALAAAASASNHLVSGEVVTGVLQRSDGLR